MITMSKTLLKSTGCKGNKKVNLYEKQSIKMLGRSKCLVFFGEASQRFTKRKKKTFKKPPVKDLKHVTVS